MKLVDTLTGLGRPVAYYPGLAIAIGSVKAAVFLCQLIYWWDRKSGDSVYKTQSEWQRETGLSRREQEGARKELRKLGLIDEYYERLNHRMHYTLNVDAVNDFWQSRMHQTATPECTKQPLGSAPNSHSSTLETTTETTTESLPAAASEPTPVREPLPMRDPLERRIDDLFREQWEYSDFGKERGASGVKKIAKLCRARSPDDPEQVAEAMIRAFAYLREREKFWGKQPFLPTRLASQWDAIASQMRDKFEHERKIADALREVEEVQL